MCRVGIHVVNTLEVGQQFTIIVIDYIVFIYDRQTLPTSRLHTRPQLHIVVE